MYCRMIYLLDDADFTLLDWPKADRYQCFIYWETSESAVKGWIENNRTRTIISKQEVLNLFDVRSKVQMRDKIKMIRLKEFDRIVVLKENRYFVLELVDYKKWEHAWKQKHL